MDISLEGESLLKVIILVNIYVIDTLPRMTVCDASVWMLPNPPYFCVTVNTKLPGITTNAVVCIREDHNGSMCCL